MLLNNTKWRGRCPEVRADLRNLAPSPCCWSQMLNLPIPSCWHSLFDRTPQDVLLSWQIFAVCRHPYLLNWSMLDAQVCLQPQRFSRRKHSASQFWLVTVNLLMSSHENLFFSCRLYAKQECVDKFKLCQKKVSIRSSPDTRTDTHMMKLIVD